MDKNPNNALQAHDLYWTSYLNGQTDVLASLLDENYQQIGSVEEEVFFNKKGAVGFVQKTIDQIVDKVEMRNRVTKSELLSGYVLINEFCDLYVKTEKKWNFYSKFRASSLLQEKADGWKLVHQHSSLPDSKTEEGENIAIEKIHQENLDLKNSIKRRTVELEQKNRELEIEAALESIRTRTLLMKDSNELNEAVAVFFQQFQQLNLLPSEARTYFCKINEESRVAEVWMTEANGKVMSGSHLTPLDKSPSLVRYYDAWLNQEPHMVRDYSGKELVEYLSFVSSLPHVKTDKDYQKIFRYPPDRIVMTDATFQQGCIGVMTFEPLSDEALDILVRFAKVFEFTYTRFLDLQKAEEQAREAQIEAAIERVRARTMAMHQSEELQEVVAMLYQEFKHLVIAEDNIDIEVCIINEATGSAEVWQTDFSFTGKQVMLHLPFTEIYPLNEEYIRWRETKPEKRHELLIVNEYSGSIFEEFLQKLASLHGWEHVIRQFRDNQIKQWFTHNAYFSHGMLTYQGVEQTGEENLKLLQRFAKVFEQTYTRFLDLQKAEEQARKAEIEAALERLRARSMGMHHSTELIEVVRLLDREIKGLGIQNVDATQIATDLSDPDEGVNIWIKVEEMNYLKKFHVPFIDHPTISKLFKASRKKEKFFTEKYSKAEKNRLFRLLFKYSDFRSIPEERKEVLLNSPGLVRSIVIHKNSALIFQQNGLDEFSEEHNAIFKRFGVVFEQAYTRFLDLQKAEEQAREAEIEASLERVRAKGMAMHSTYDIESATAVVFNELSRLGIDLERCGITLMNETPIAELWSTTLSHDNKEVIDIVTGYLDFRNHPLTQKSYRDWKEKKKFSTYYLVGEELKKYYDKLEKQPEYKFPKVDSYPDQQVLHSFFFNAGAIFVYTTTELSNESKNIVHRFTKVFEQTYTRFLDLQKAETQAKEAQIEAALERVRARSMAMQKSDELHDVLSVLFDQFYLLGIKPVNVFLSLFNRENRTLTYRATGTGGSRTQGQQIVSLDSLEVWKELFEKWNNDNSDSVEVIYYEKEILPTLFGLLEETFSSMPESERLTIDHFPEGGYTAHGYTPFGYIGFNHTRRPTDEEKDILTKFASEFSRVYQRFLDIERAEAQSRESEIQLALERVRARTMAMHNSDELGDVASVLFEQISYLTSTPDRFNIAIANDADESFDIFITDQNGFEIKNRFEADIEGSTVLAEAFENWKNDAPHLIQDIHSKKLENWIRYMGDIVGIPFNMEQVKEHRFLSSVFFSHGFIGITTHEEPDSEIIQLLKRFSKVFQQTYTRFLDLQKAEEQAREAKIETALEKIRSRTMGMQSSEELPEVANIMFLEVQALGIPAWSCGYCILLDDGKSSTCIMSSEGTLQKPFLLPHSGEASFIEWDKFVQSDETFFTQELGGKAIESHYNFMKSLPQLTPIFRELQEAGLSLPTYQINHLCKISHGFLLFITYEPVPDAHDIFKRFTKVFEQTYTRFLDLKKAEKLALETARQSSLDRIRAEIGSMRRAEDLQQITPIIWDELKTLGIPFIRCGVFIIDEENELSHTYLSTSQGEPIAALHLPLEDIPLVKNAVSSWKQKKIYTEHWDEEDFRDWTQNLIDRGFIDSKKKYEAGSAPETLDLHFLPFKHGMLYIGNTEPLSQEKLDLGQSMAKAFSVAYDRFEDFNKLEQAKQKIEEAFRELEAAKDQLVQQEKLASLGQLTAGIAHEIKNPLNFVNNFSELSLELVEEAREELSDLSRQLSEGAEKSPLEGSAEAKRRRGVSDEAANHTLILDILNDIEINLQKIHKHGTRADGIVKSMLQHSRGGSGKMVPTDINVLIKEYANLAFHGMRAGKDPINVDIELDLDENVGEVEMIAEDFSRVILNLCNNAFDAMREKLRADSRQLSENPNQSYEPILSIRTHRKDSKITIEIEDNGPGIPEEIKDKILQPFFTTKKGTQGTGLGLSITHDIIKAHGGSLTIDHAHPTGTSFQIQLTI